MKPRVARSLTALALIAAAAPAAAAGLDLTVEGVRNANGSVLVLVFDDARGFEELDWSRAIQFAEIPAQPGRVSWRFPDLTSGPYAIFVLHDENGDEDLNYRGNQLLEGIGSTGVTSATPYPDFAQAAIRPGTVTVRLYYDQ